MAYTINLTNGTVLTTIADGTVNDTSTSLTLIGKNYSGYGTYLNDNLVHILENSASDTSPTTPLTGQLWWDTAGNLNVYTGSRFVNLAAITSSISQPTGPKVGNQWWDTANQQFNIYNGSGWTLIGPAFTSNTGTSGTIVGTILDSNAASHVAVNVYVSNTLVGIISKDSTYTPATSITGFSTIKPGFNLVSVSAVSGVAFWGTASDASGLGNIAAANYARTDVAETFDSTITVNTNSGITVGTANNFTTGVSGNIVQLTNNVNNADIAIRANIGGTLATAIGVAGASGAVTVPNVLTTGGNLTSTGYLTVSQGENATSNVTGAVRVTGGIGLTGSIYSTGAITATGALTVGSMTTTGNISAQVGTFSSNVNTTGLTSSGSITATTLGLTGNLTTTANVTVTGNINAAYLVGTAVQSWYADLAERFEADDVYGPGTVLSIGGSAEVTLEDQELSEDVFGVVSTNAGYLMNAGMGPDATHPQVAVNGRVPVKVIGRVKKGDRLVSAGGGKARAGAKSELTPHNVIGRSLQNKDTDGEGTVLAIVKLNS